jgi:hypothetical protein
LGRIKLVYVIYNSIAYAVATPFTWPFVPYLALIALSVYTVIRLLASLDAAAIRQRFSGAVWAVWERLAGGVLVGLGGLNQFRTPRLVRHENRYRLI